MVFTDIPYLYIDDIKYLTDCTNEIAKVDMVNFEVDFPAMNAY